MKEESLEIPKAWFGNADYFAMRTKEGDIYIVEKPYEAGQSDHLGNVKYKIERVNHE